jgi:hypothetical protein
VRPSLTFWVLLAFIGFILCALVVPKIGHGGGEIRYKSAYADIHGFIKTALDAYEVDNGSYPKSLQDLLQQPTGTTNWHGPYSPTDVGGSVGSQIFLRLSRQAYREWLRFIFRWRGWQAGN